jgi:hypothetical protein
MNYPIEQIRELAKGIYPKRCIFSYDTDDPSGYSDKCLIDKGCTLGAAESTEKCLAWRGINLFDVEKLAQDILETKGELCQDAVQQDAVQ